MSGDALHQSARYWVAVALLLLVGAWLRLYQLDQYPLGVHQDELSDIYDGYSLAQTGADRFGARFPLAVRAFGENDFRPSLFAWLTAIPQRFTGFSIVAGRLPSALLGVSSLILIFLFAQRMAGWTFGLAALLFASLSPLHIQYSRVAHQGAIFPAFFVILILVLWQRAALARYAARAVILLGFVIGLSSSAYQATRLMSVLFVLGVAVEILRHSQDKARRLIVFFIAALVGALPQMIVFLEAPSRFFARARLVSISADNPISYVAQLITNYWLNLEPRYLFVPREVSDLTVARLLPPEIVFFYVGLFALAFVGRGKGHGRALVYFAMIVSILPAALTEGNPNTLRSSGIAVLTPLFSAAGLLALAALASNARIRNRVYYPAAAVLIIASSAALVYRYSRSEYFREVTFQKLLVDLGTKLRDVSRSYDDIYVEKVGSEQYIYLAAFGGISPREFQTGPKEYYSVGMDIFTRVGKYRIVPDTAMDAAVATALTTPRRVLVVASRKDPQLVTLDSVSFRDQRVYFLARNPPR